MGHFGAMILTILNQNAIIERNIRLLAIGCGSLLIASHLMDNLF